ncbi:hypothetical protein P4324_15975 [Bacillus thuringiensis]|nr:hypothetical protein [Bacillus thuringiensis]MED2923536.1 hypothetical protein [Bacillus thuringiensis]MED3046951.1 hypothetical protein [Bacillus thuringiensis]
MNYYTSTTPFKNSTVALCPTNCHTSMPPPPPGVCCVTVDAYAEFLHLVSDSSARERVVQQQQGNPGYNPYYNSFSLPCKPPLGIIGTCIANKRWATIISPLPGGGTEAHFVFITGIMTQQDPTKPGTIIVITGVELYFDPNVGAFTFIQYAQPGENVCGVSGCF